MSDTSKNKEIKSSVKETVKDMSLEELMVAIEQQNNGLLQNLHGVILSQIDVIKTQQEEMVKLRDVVNLLTKSVTQIQAQTNMLVEKQKQLEEFATIASGIKKVSETTVGVNKLKEEAEKFIKKQEESEEK